MSALERLSAAECWTILGAHAVGRVAFTEHAQPAIVPVDYTLDGERVVLKCVNESLAANLDGQVVAFEVGDTDGPTSERRTVVVTGKATQVSSARALPAAGWARAPVDGRTTVCISIGKVLGRRLRAA
jgi:nitroimidazol reductase NimA-like FMN-containing flavoprotein (pyridoxamine 5'-phosphate oxidase superfamily)